MKKFYNDPVMNISFFEQENVVTTASGGTPKNAVNAAESWLDTKAVSKDNIANLVF